MEVCVDRIESVMSAFNGGAKRVELCSALSEGGLTPSVGLLQVARTVTSPHFPIFVMIRPRGGDDFRYSDVELDVMETDLIVLAQHGADGFVFGCLLEDKSVDKAACQRLLKAAGHLPCTFHRAFDECSKPEEVLKDIIQLGFKRLLTSGCQTSAELGKDLIRKLVLSSKESGLIVMPGAGVNSVNLQGILEETRAIEFHGSARQNGEAVTSEALVRNMIAVASTMGVY